MPIMPNMPIMPIAHHAYCLLCLICPSLPPPEQKIKGSKQPATKCASNMLPCLSLHRAPASKLVPPSHPF